MKSRRLRIGWASNVPWGYSGYATQTNLIVPRLKEAGFPIAVNGFAGFACGFINTSFSEFQFKGRWEGIPFYPTLDHVFGSDGLTKNLQEDFKADIIIPFQDIHTLHPDDLKQVKRLVPYVPIDRTPVPPAVMHNLNLAWRIISYSQWGQDELLKKGYASEMIPHGVDTNIFKPLDKAEIKKKWQISPDTFVWGMVAANKEWPPRKGFQYAMDAFYLFQQKHPDSIMWFHTYVNQPGGFDIVSYANFLGIGHKVRYVNHKDMVYYQMPEMNHVYNMFDCLLAPSYSEGFGLPAIEAQAAGVPVIVNGFSSQPELIVDGKTGFICQSGIKRFDLQGAYHREVDGDSLCEAMEKMYAADRVEMGKEAREYVLRHYDIDMLVKTRWVPYLERLENEIYGPLPPEPDELDDALESSLQSIQKQFGQNTVRFID